MKEKMKGNWLSKHLNWTLFLYAYILPSLIWVLFLMLPMNSAVLLILILLYIGLLIWLIWVTFWYLKNKSRSLWNILWHFTAIIGFIVLLVLENKNTMGGYYNLLWEDDDAKVAA